MIDIHNLIIYSDPVILTEELSSWVWIRLDRVLADVLASLDCATLLLISNKFNDQLVTKDLHRPARSRLSRWFKQFFSPIQST